jgi:hypothetical protein
MRVEKMPNAHNWLPTLDFQPARLTALRWADDCDFDVMS